MTTNHPTPDYGRKYLLTKIDSKVKQWAKKLTDILPPDIRVFASFHVAERILDRMNGEYAIVLLVATKWIKSNPDKLVQDIDVLIRYKDFRLLINCEPYTQDDANMRQVRLNTVLTDTETIPIREKKGKPILHVTYTLKDL